MLAHCHHRDFERFRLAQSSRCAAAAAAQPAAVALAPNVALAPDVAQATPVAQRLPSPGGRVEWFGEERLGFVASSTWLMFVSLNQALSGLYLTRPIFLGRPVKHE